VGFNNTFRNINRLRQILAVLVKYGFEDVIANSTLRNAVPERLRIKWMRAEQPALQYTRWERIRMAAEELGPTFIKLAQILSNRPDIIPQALVKEFEKLQDKVPPFSSDEARRIVEMELGKPIDDVFEYFSFNPIASASIGQVHRARLKSGLDVVVKVQRPGIQEIVERDLSILAEIVRRSDRYLKKQGLLNGTDMVAVFERSITKELDYSNEARNMTRFRELYKSYKNFLIPRPIREISTQKVLVIEFVDGCKFTDVKQIKAWGLNPHRIVENGFKIYLTQIFEYGIFHADPHPGNVMVTRDGTITLLDFGMVGQLSKKDKYAFANVFIGMAQQDARKMAINLKRLSIEDDIKDMRAFENDLNEIIEDYATLNVSEGSIADLVASLQKLMLRYQMAVPPSIFLIFRALTILEGIGKIMHPELKTFEYIRPFGAKIMQEQWSAENIWNEVSIRAEQISSLLTSFPTEVREILKQARKGKLHFEVELQGYGYLLKKMDSITNRITITLIICALLIGSSILATVKFADEFTTNSGLPVFSAAGFTIAGVLFVILVYATLRRRYYK
jgi:ubiquinone biosynthesis protein